MTTDLLAKAIRRAGALRVIAEQRRGERYAMANGASGWRTFAGLAPTSWTLSCLRPTAEVSPHVSLLLPAVGPGMMFAGIRTAMSAATRIALEVGRPLRVVTFGSAPSEAERAWLDDFVRTEFKYVGPAVELLWGWALRDLPVSEREVWIGTYWTLAHALDVAARIGRIDPAQVCYLVQDYEPSFFAGSTESAVAQSTYHAGFNMLVNSTPVQRALSSHEGIEIAPERVFRPDLDLDRLERVASRRGPADVVTIGFYGRPSKPRNSFALGVASLRQAVIETERRGVRASFVSVGEAHGAVALGDGVRLRSVGKLSWDEYFEELAKIDVMLSLQQSPHPSHPPLESVASFGHAVTNAIDETRKRLSQRLLAVPNDPGRLGTAIAEAALAAREARPQSAVDTEFLSELGVPLESAIDSLLGSGTARADTGPHVPKLGSRDI